MSLYIAASASVGKIIINKIGASDISTVVMIESYQTCFVTAVNKEDMIIYGKFGNKIKDIVRVKCIIDLPYSKIDSENHKLLNEMKIAKPEDIYYGSFDVVTRDEKGKVKIVYSHIDGVIGALESAIEAGVKHYKLTYSIKKLSAESEFDFKGHLAKEREKEFQMASKKSKTKHLI